jgi:hypothetical protein
MKIIELLASQLDREAQEHEVKAAQHIFTEGIEFWQLCLEAQRLILEREEAKKCLPSQPMKPVVGASK